MPMMKAALCDRYGPPEVLRLAQVEMPVPRDGEVRIKIFATSVTNSDIFIRSSKVSPALIIPMRLMIGIRRPRNPIIGEVFAGEIEAVGPRIRRFAPGDKVYGFTGMSLGAYADYKCMRETDSKKGCLAKMPRNVTFEEATSAAYGGLLAFQFLEKKAIAPGHQVLVYGASGTSGTVAVQYAKQAGARVTAVCGPAHVDLARKLGADVVLDYAKDDSVMQLRRYDFVLDAVGKARTSALKKACRRSLAKNGRYASIDDEALLLDSERLGRVTTMVEAGHLVPITDRVYPFSEIADAHVYVENGHKTGNVAVTVNGR